MRELERLSVCSRCARVYGSAQDVWGHSRQVLRQSCDCDGEDRTQPGTRWYGYDFNEHTTLCYCCGREPLKSGYKFSVWFCEVCKKQVFAFNKSYGMAVIPVGRHSLMNGIFLQGDPEPKWRDIEQFHGELMNFADSIGVLEEWSKQVVKRQLAALGPVVSQNLVFYLQELELREKNPRPGLPAPLSKKEAFEALTQFILSGGDEQPS